MVGVAVLAMLALPLGVVVFGIVYLIWYPRLGGKVAGLLTVASITGICVAMIGLLYSYARFEHGLTCPPRTNATGTAHIGGWAEPSWCTYSRGDVRLADHQDPGLLFSGWWFAVGAGALLATAGIAIFFARRIVRGVGFLGRQPPRSIDHVALGRYVASTR